eukprot:534469-Lingulodinium_polyedra.AAC.1
MLLLPRQGRQIVGKKAPLYQHQAEHSEAQQAELLTPLLRGRPVRQVHLRVHPAGVAKLLDGVSGEDRGRWHGDSAQAEPWVGLTHVEPTELWGNHCPPSPVRP